MKLPKVKKVYHKYDNWECFHSGMYSPVVNSLLQENRERYKDFLSDLELFNSAISKVFQEWKISCENFLTNQEINRIAWLGQASACIQIQVSSAYCSGFWLLDEKQQQAANKLAFNRIREWIIEYNENTTKNQPVCGNMGKQLLFKWYT